MTIALPPLIWPRKKSRIGDFLRSMAGGVHRICCCDDPTTSCCKVGEDSDCCFDQTEHSGSYVTFDGDGAGGDFEFHSCWHVGECDVGAADFFPDSSGTESDRAISIPSNDLPQIDGECGAFGAMVLGLIADPSVTTCDAPTVTALFDISVWYGIVDPFDKWSALIHQITFSPYRRVEVFRSWEAEDFVVITDTQQDCHGADVLISGCDESEDYTFRDYQSRVVIRHRNMNCCRNTVTDACQTGSPQANGACSPP